MLRNYIAAGIVITLLHLMLVACVFEAEYGKTDNGVECTRVIRGMILKDDEVPNDEE